MSVPAMKWARGKAPTFGSGAVLLAVCDRADEHGIAWPSQETLYADITAAKCADPTRTIRDNLRRLEERRLIGRVPRRSAAGYRTSDWLIVAPLAQERGEMVDVDDDEIAVGRWPEAVGQLARRCADDQERTRLFVIYLPERNSGRTDVRAESARTHLPEFASAPTGVSLHATRSLAPSLPESDSGEQLVERLEEQEEELTPPPTTSFLPSERTNDGGGEDQPAMDGWTDEETRSFGGGGVVEDDSACLQQGNSCDSEHGGLGTNGNVNGHHLENGGGVVPLVPGPDGLIPPSTSATLRDMLAHHRCIGGAGHFAAELGLRLEDVYPERRSMGVPLEELLEPVTELEVVTE